MSFSELDVTRRTRKGNFLKKIEQLIDWDSVEQAIAVHYFPISDAAGDDHRPILDRCCLRCCWWGSGTVVYAMNQ